MKTYNVPSPDQVREALSAMSERHMRKLSELSGVPISTVRKIKFGQTPDPGISKVHAMMPHVEKAKAA